MHSFQSCIQYIEHQPNLDEMKNQRRSNYINQPFLWINASYKKSEKLSILFYYKQDWPYIWPSFKKWYTILF